jgi:hypothetical protein
MPSSRSDTADGHVLMMEHPLGFMILAAIWLRKKMLLRLTFMVMS